MRQRSVWLATGSVTAVVVALVLAACGGSPTRPSNTPGGGGSSQQPPPNNLPVIDSIAVQGTRAKEPPNFADLGETVAVTAKVHDDETAADQLQYVWTATAGTFSGTGANVMWQAPSAAATPAEVTITLKVVEKYGSPAASFQHEVTGTEKLSLHDSIKEVGDMARQFLLDFSDTHLKDADYIMRNFSSERCPNPKDVQAERSDVTNHFTNFQTVSFRIGTPIVTVNFGGICAFRNRPGDACAIVPSFWDAIDVRDNTRGAVDGDDYLGATYSQADARFWLCSSDYQGHRVSGVTLRGFIR
jgi:hypothetical protein